MSGVSKVNKKSNLELLLLELLEADNTREQLFSIDSAADANLQDREFDINEAEQEAKEIEAILYSGNGTVKQSEPAEMNNKYTPDNLKESIFAGLSEGESERGGIKQQIYICSVLQQSQRYPGWQFVSNQKGEQNPDISIIPPNKKPSFVEVKSREGGLVAIYDKTVKLNSYDIIDFDNIAKALAKENNIKIYKKLANGKINELNIDKLKPGNVFEAILTQGSLSPEGKPDCGRYGKLTADKEAIAIMSKRKIPFGKFKFCSHQSAGFSVIHPDSGKTVQAFIPRGTNDNLSLNKKIYFYNPEKNLYSEIDVKSKTTDTDWVIVGGKTYLAPDGSVRPAADAGTVSSKCFSYKRKTGESKEIMTDSSDVVVNIAHNTIINHWKKENGADDYFMIVSGNEIYPYLIPGRPNVLGLPIPLFTPDVINSVSLTTYGKGGIDAIRLAIKCDIAMSTTLQSLLSIKGQVSENVKRLLERILG
jgi:hypothetical protein